MNSDSKFLEEDISICIFPACALSGCIPIKEKMHSLNSKAKSFKAFSNFRCFGYAKVAEDETSAFLNVKLSPNSDVIA